MHVISKNYFYYVFDKIIINANLIIDFKSNIPLKI